MQPQRVVPERVDLHRFAAARSDDPAIHFRIHPGELIALRALAQQAIRWIDADAEARAATDAASTTSRSLGRISRSVSRSLVVSR